MLQNIKQTDKNIMPVLAEDMWNICETKREISELEKNLTVVRGEPFQEIAQGIFESGWKGHIDNFANSAQIFQKIINDHSKSQKRLKN